MNYLKMTDVVRANGGSSPFNLLPIANSNSTDSGGAHGHGAATPDALIEWWVRYITKPGDLVCDPFMGSGTTALVARRLGRDYLGCDLSASYVAMALHRLAQTDPYEDRTLPDGSKQLSLFAME